MRADKPFFSLSKIARCGSLPLDIAVPTTVLHNGMKYPSHGTRLCCPVHQCNSRLAPQCQLSFPLLVQIELSTEFSHTVT